MKIFKCNYDRESLSEYFQTIKIINMLHHTNICHIYCTLLFPKEISTLFHIMETYSKSLAYYNTKCNDTSSLNIKQIMLGLCEGIKCLNSCNIIHGNLKLENILLNEDGTCSISDYGINNIKIKDNYNKKHYEFQSPEQIMSKEIDIKTDIWSIGCIFYFLLQSQIPFEASSLYDLECKILSVDYAKVITNKNYKKIISKLIVVNPNERMSIDGVLSSFKGNNIF